MPPTLGERLKHLIKQSGLEQQEVAARLGLKPSTFNGYVVDKREPSIEKLKQFAQYFHVSVDYLVGLSDERSPDLSHLPEDLKSFVCDPGNVEYLMLLKELKARTIGSEKIHRKA